MSTCELCGREVAEITKHHLIPQTRHKNKKNKKDFERKEVKDRIAWLCGPCHNQVHATISEKELERAYNTIEALQNHPQLTKWIEWISKRPDGTKVPVRKRK